MLQQGQAVIDDFKSEAEGVIGQVNEAIETVTGLWAWLQGLFGVQESKQTPQVALQSPAAPQQNKEHDPDLLQMQTVHEVSQQLGTFFDIQQQIQTHYKNLEDTSMHVYDADQNHAMKAIERVEVELQLEEMTVKIRETMVYAPKELKDLYTRFLTMYGHIKEEQEFARQEQIRNMRNKRWRQEVRRNFRIDLLMAGAAAMVVWLVLAGMMMQVASLSGRSPEWFSLESFVSFVSRFRPSS
jgi:hypothetical protein